MDSGMITGQADWSLDFDIGMNFMEWHAPGKRRGVAEGETLIDAERPVHPVPGVAGAGQLEMLPRPPMEYITRQCQGDFALLDQRLGNLWMDSGMITGQADCSRARYPVGG
jgi:hypothetical protein